MPSRFRVSTCEGYLWPQGGHGGPPVGLSAYVLDTHYCHNVVGSFRSEDFELERNAKGQIKGGKRMSKGGALLAAHRLCDELNADDARL